MGIIRKIFHVGMANGIQVISSALLGLLIPRYLSIEGYADYRTFTLFVGYIGLFHLGYADGIFIDYAGKTLQEQNKEIIRGDFIQFLAIEAALTLGLTMLSALLHSNLLMLLSMAVVPYNINTYFQRLFQSVGRLDVYSNSIFYYSCISTAGTLLLIFILNYPYVDLFCMVLICSNAAASVYQYYRFHCIVGDISHASFSINRIRYLVKTGFAVLLGNIAVNLFYGIDRWVVRLFFSTEEFAYYSFAVSMLNILTTLLQSVSISLFSYLATDERLEKVEPARRVILSVGILSGLCYFPLRHIVSVFLPEYLTSLSIIGISIAMIPYMLYINAITINVYKIKKKQTLYLKTMIVMLIIVIVSALIASTFRDCRAIALSSVICYMGWYIYSRHIADEYDYVTALEFVILACITLCYLICTEITTTVGLALYSLASLLACLFLLYPIRYKLLKSINLCDKHRDN